MGLFYELQFPINLKLCMILGFDVPRKICWQKIPGNVEWWLSFVPAMHYYFTTLSKRALLAFYNPFNSTIDFVFLKRVFKVILIGVS